MEGGDAKKKAVLERYFPNAVISGILSRLPIKSLVRFQCVSMPWRGMISDVKFNLYGNRPRVLMCMEEIRENRRNIDISFHSIDNSYFNGDSVVLDVANLPFPLGNILQNLSPYQAMTQTPRLLGCCNGLFLFSLQSCMYLWNPATRACKEVFQLDCLKEAARIYASGLCLDEVSGKYKVVMGLVISTHSGLDISQFRRGSVRFATLGRDNGWSEMGMDYDLGRPQGVGTVFGGRLHWMVRETGDDVPSPNWNCIIYFDPPTNQFQKLPMPDVEQIHGVGVKHSVATEEFGSRICSLGILDGCLCLLYQC